MNIDKLKLFIAVAESLSFTKASEMMHLSQSNVSRYIAELESTLQTELFERTTRSVKLTQTGTLFLAEAKLIIHSYNSIVERVTNLGKGLSGSLTIGYIDVYTANILPIAVKSFRKKYPLVDLRLVETASEVSQKAVQSGHIDLGFLIYVHKVKFARNIQNRHIQKGALDIVVSDEHPLASHKITSIQNLENETIHTYHQDVAPGLYNTVNDLCISNNFTPKLDSNHTKASSIMLMVESGLGVTIVSSLTSSIYTPKNALKAIRMEGADIPSYLDMIWRKGDTNPCIYNFIHEIDLFMARNQMIS